MSRVQVSRCFPLPPLRRGFFLKIRSHHNRRLVTNFGIITRLEAYSRVSVEYKWEIPFYINFSKKGTLEQSILIVKVHIYKIIMYTCYTEKIIISNRLSGTCQIRIVIFFLKEAAREL